MRGIERDREGDRVGEGWGCVRDRGARVAGLVFDDVVSQAIALVNTEQQRW